MRLQFDFTTTDNSKQKAGSALNRASTIRASDFRQSTASPVVTGVSCTSHTRHTRSGTVVGRPGSGVVISSVLFQRSIDSSSQCQSQVRTTAQSEVAHIESDDELLLKAPGWLDEDLEYLGLPMYKFHSRALGPQPGEECDEELLLTGKRRYVRQLAEEIVLVEITITSHKRAPNPTSVRLTEAAESRSAIHHRSDVYSSAVALFAILGTWWFPTYRWIL